ncbi:hypothetical protein H5410_004559 [Solanum commersonii]|uniref:Uncharacterized protein n=1 Tax=Solanum commersonii TaxID=4109 RepID=A0A9J6B8C3_SOLCO|nr:hypothetical protein H5410_004559 [Solanum commersonii]
MSILSLGNQSSGLGFAISFSNKLKTHGLDLSKERRIQETHYQIERDETLFFFKFSKSSPNL